MRFFRWLAQVTEDYHAARKRQRKLPALCLIR
jgi:hypothetical protein